MSNISKQVLALRARRALAALTPLAPGDWALVTKPLDTEEGPIWVRGGHPTGMDSFDGKFVVVSSCASVEGWFQTPKGWVFDERWLRRVWLP